MFSINSKAKKTRNVKENIIYGDNLGFESREAYKLLRTNLIFSLAEKENCRVIGMSSSIRGEGKSTTTINLGISLAEVKKKVLIIEMDMRLPNIARSININKNPGFSELLVGLNNIEEVIQPSGLEDNLDIITAGSIPPNPSELLSSDKVGEYLEILKGKYDYILFDLPPVNIVSDTLIVSKYTDGIILVIRQNYNTRKELNEAMRQIKLADIKILGFVINDSSNKKDKYKKKKYGYKYYGYQKKSDDEK